VLFLDEPTTGVDPVSRTEFWDMLGRLRDRGITIVVSTPYMDEAARCERIALIQHGRIIALDTLAGMIASHDTPTYAVRGAQPLHVLQALRAYPLTDHCFAFGREQHLVLKPAAGGDDPAILAGVQAYLEDHGHPAVDVHRITPTIEDVFIHLAHERDHG
jgi:ABC-2 type transport system ATP-binding protein